MAEKITLELSREQARAVMQATELLARLEIGQFNEVAWVMINRFTDSEGKFDSDRRDLAESFLSQACNTIFGTNKYGWPDIQEKSTLHSRCWAVYTTIRHALAWHDHPEGGITVDFDKPLGYGEKMPKCAIEEGD